jgi:hypothetical protein
MWLLWAVPDNWQVATRLAMTVVEPGPGFVILYLTHPRGGSLPELLCHDTRYLLGLTH